MPYIYFKYRNIKNVFKVRIQNKIGGITNNLNLGLVQKTKNLILG